MAMLGQGRMENTKGPREEDFSGEMGDAPKSEIFNTIFQRIASMKNGTKEHPALTCGELFRLHKTLPSGMYWIDPDAGEITNSIQVFCDRSTEATCLEAKPSEFEKIKKVSEDGFWLSDFDGTQISYKADSKQIRHLQQLSEKVSQNITITLIGSNSASEKLKRESVKLLSWNDVTLTELGNIQHKYSIQIHEDSKGSQRISNQIVSYSTDKTTRLPIIDIWLKENDVTVKIGNPCFY